MGNGGIQLRIGDLLFAVQKRWKIILTLTFLGGIFGLLLSGMSYVQSSLASYNISGSVAINTRTSDGKYLYGDTDPSQNDFHLAEDMVDSVMYIMRSARVLEEVINRQELLGVSYTEIQNGMSISVYNSTQILEFSINWTNDAEGIAIWRSIIEVSNEVMPDTLTIGHVAIINDCTATLVGVGGSGRNIPILLAALGFAAGIGFAIMELLMHPTLTNVKDVETVFGLETIGIIPRNERHFKKKQSILVKDESGSSVILQNYSAAAFILRNRLGTKEDHHCFYVTSAVNGEGRSTVTANLAIQLSDMEHRTLLVDFDFKNPSLGTLFMNSVDYEHSLNALYRGDINEQEAVTTLTGYLDILPAVLEHNMVPMDSTVIELIRKLSERYEYIILDAPPVGKESEALSLNQLADTVLFVIGYDNSSIPEIQSALDKLDKSGIRVLGCIVNNVQGTRYKEQDNTKTPKKKKAKTEEAMSSEQQEATDLPLVKSKTKKQKASDKKKKKGKKGSASEATSPEAPAATNVHTPRNVIDELMDEASSSKRMDDQDVLTELYKIGIQGEEEKPQDTAEKEDVSPGSGVQGETAPETHESEPSEASKETPEKPETEEAVTAEESGEAPEAETVEETPEAELQEAPKEAAKEPEDEAEEDVAVEEAGEAPEAETAEEAPEAEPQETTEESAEEPEDEAEEDVAVEEVSEVSEAESAEEASEPEPQEAPEESAEELENEAEEDTAEEEASVVPEAVPAEEAFEPEPQEAPEEATEEPEDEAEEDTAVEEISEATEAETVEEASAPQEAPERPSRRWSNELRAEDDKDAGEIQEVSTSDVWNTDGWGNP